MAEQLTIPFLTLPALVEEWIRQERPTLPEVEALLIGFKAARFALAESDLVRLKSALKRD
ncbi:MAG: hypothetical protein M3498_12520 [Deinococcota bacterium]|nr:hypothetical protein [Deinococcota bacterium]